VDGNWQQLTGGTTGLDGKLSFSELPAGDYKVVESLTDPEYYNTSGLEQTITLDYPEHKTLYFGNRRFDMDYGDLPEEYEMTLFGKDGARHNPLLCAAMETECDVWLGEKRDAEYDGNPHSAAMGDDGHNDKDEDGVVRGSSWGGTTGVISVTVNGPSCLMGWVDFAKVDGSNNLLDLTPDFKFTEVISGTQKYNELVINNRYLTAGTTTITFPLPPNFANTSVFARFRLSPYDSSKGNTEGRCNQDPAGLTGLVLGGEVEDYYWSFGPTSVELKKLNAAPQQSSSAFGLLLAGLVASLTALGIGLRTKRNR